MEALSATTIAARRFGYGSAAAGTDAAGLLDGLRRPDRMATAWPVALSAAAVAAGKDYQDRRKLQRDPGAEGDLARAAIRRLRDMADSARLAAFARILDTDTPFRERLVWFWADHFTVRAKDGWQQALPGAFVDEAVRPHLSGSFGAMLKAAVTHPAMVLYLDQARSVGPGSPAGLRHHRGLNENLAREVLELHTLGVGSAYSQTDVTQFARLLTGLTYENTRGAVFKERLAEPGAETLLGVRYGGGPPALDDILRALDDLALRPETAAHLARKLAVHFVSDSPPDRLVAAMVRAWIGSGGDLMAVYAALLGDPAAFAPPLAKVRQPFDWLAAALRALGTGGAQLAALPEQQMKRLVDHPLAVMGQPFQRPIGPNGWPEDNAHWLTPQGLAERVAWSMRAPSDLRADLPEPAAFATRVLGEPDRDLMVAVSRAETRADAIGLVLASPAFMRR